MKQTIQVIRSDRRTVSLEISPSGQILVRAPRHMSEAEICKFIEDKSSWLAKYLKKREENMKSLQVEGKFTEQEIEKLVKLAKQVIAEKVAYYARLMDVSYGRISIRKQKTRWGSCSSKGNLNFNCLLMLFLEDVIDYVVVHELCHRKHMNHSAQFYAEVEHVFTEYRRYQKWLKENGGFYLSRLP